MWTRGKQKVSKQTQNHPTLLNTNKLFTMVSARKKTFHGLFCCPMKKWRNCLIWWAFRTGLCGDIAWQAKRIFCYFLLLLCVLSSNWVQDCKKALYFEKHDPSPPWFQIESLLAAWRMDWWFGLSRSLKWSRKTVSPAAPQWYVMVIRLSNDLRDWRSILRFLFIHVSSWTIWSLYMKLSVPVRQE